MVDTPRLILRRFRPTDLDALVELNRDPEVMRYITGRPTPADEVRDRLLPEYLAGHERSGGPGHWAADERATGVFQGWFALRPVDFGLFKARRDCPDHSRRDLVLQLKDVIESSVKPISP